MLLLIHLSLLEFAVLLAGAVILGLAVYFFIITQRSLRQTLEKANSKTTLFHKPSTASLFREQKPAPSVLETAREPKIKQVLEPEMQPAAKLKLNPKEESIESLKDTVLQQQKLLNSFLRQVEEIESEGREELEMQNKHLQAEVRSLEMQLDKKDAELEDLRQKAALSERMASRIDEVYQEFELLQTKMEVLEKQASRANNLALELEDTRQSYEQVHKELQRKAERLEEAFFETQRLQQQVNTLEDKLSEANLQRQQLQKKVQFLQDLNTDLQTVSDTNKKLHTELRRIGELESMLNMIAEERDYLLKKQGDK